MKKQRASRKGNKKVKLRIIHKNERPEESRVNALFDELDALLVDYCLANDESEYKAMLNESYKKLMEASWWWSSFTVGENDED